MNEPRAIPVDAIDGGDRTDEQRAHIERIGRGVANLLASAPDYEVLIDVLTGAIVSAALNTGGDEDLIGNLVAEAMKCMPHFKANREARRASPRGH